MNLQNYKCHVTEETSVATAISEDNIVIDGHISHDKKQIKFVHDTCNVHGTLVMREVVF